MSKQVVYVFTGVIAKVFVLEEGLLHSASETQAKSELHFIGGSFNMRLDKMRELLWLLQSWLISWLQ